MARHVRDRGYLREQALRIVKKRRNRYYREMRAWRRPETRTGNRDEWEARSLSFGRLSKTDPWDCGSRCYLCHWDKFFDNRRARERRQWKREEEEWRQADSPDGA